MTILDRILAVLTRCSLWRRCRNYRAGSMCDGVEALPGGYECFEDKDRVKAESELVEFALANLEEKIID